MTDQPFPDTDEDWRYLRYDALEAFSPGAPIDDFTLLAGRTKQIERDVKAGETYCN